MPPEVIAAPAAPSSMPEPHVPAASVEKMNSVSAPEKSLPPLDDSFASFFKDKFKDGTPEEPKKVKTEAKTEPKKEPEVKPQPEKLVKDVVDTPTDQPKKSKVLDPEAIVPDKNTRSDKGGAWDQMKENSKQIFNENKKLSEKIKSLEAVVAQKGGLSQEEIKTLKTQIEELRPYREMVDIQHDPDFRKTYDEPMEAAKQSIHKILKGLQTPDEAIGRFNFLDTAEVDRIVGILEEGGQKTLSRRVLAHAEEFQKLHEKRQEAVGNAKTKFAEFSKNREASELTKQTESEAVMNQVVRQAYDLKDDQGAPQLPYFITKEMPVNATKEQLDEVERHNEMAEKLQGEVQNILKSKEPEVRAITALRAVFGAVRDAQYKGAMIENGELRAELKRVSVSGSEKRNVSAPKTSTTPLNTMSAEESMQNFFSNRKR